MGSFERCLWDEFAQLINRQRTRFADGAVLILLINLVEDSQ